MRSSRQTVSGATRTPRRHPGDHAAASVFHPPCYVQEFSVTGLTPNPTIFEAVARFAKAGIYTDAPADQLLDEGAASFVKSWKDLMECIASKSAMLKAA